MSDHFHHHGQTELRGAMIRIEMCSPIECGQRLFGFAGSEMDVAHRDMGFGTLIVDECGALTRRQGNRHQIDVSSQFVMLPACGTQTSLSECEVPVDLHGPFEVLGGVDDIVQCSFTAKACPAAEIMVVGIFVRCRDFDEVLVAQQLDLQDFGNGASDVFL